MIAILTVRMKVRKSKKNKSKSKKHRSGINAKAADRVKNQNV